MSRFGLLLYCNGFWGVSVTGIVFPSGWCDVVATSPEQVADSVATAPSLFCKKGTAVSEVEFVAPGIKGELEETCVGSAPPVVVSTEPDKLFVEGELSRVEDISSSLFATPTNGGAEGELSRDEDISSSSLATPTNGGAEGELSREEDMSSSSLATPTNGGAEGELSREEDMSSSSLASPLEVEANKLIGKSKGVTFSILSALTKGVLILTILLVLGSALEYNSPSA